EDARHLTPGHIVHSEARVSASNSRIRNHHACDRRIRIRSEKPRGPASDLETNRLLGEKQPRLAGVPVEESVDDLATLRELGRTVERSEARPRRCIDTHVPLRPAAPWAHAELAVAIPRSHLPPDFDLIVRAREQEARQEYRSQRALHR